MDRGYVADGMPLAVTQEDLLVSQVHLQLQIHLALCSGGSKGREGRAFDAESKSAKIQSGWGDGDSGSQHFLQDKIRIANAQGRTILSPNSLVPRFHAVFGKNKSNSRLPP